MLPTVIAQPKLYERSEIANDDNEKDIVSSYEAEMIAGNAIRSGQVFKPDSTSRIFPSLVDEFRDGYVGSANVRQGYSTFFLSQPEFLSSEITLEILECGKQLCVAELRSSDYAALKIFTRDLSRRDGYEAKATLEFPSNQINVVRLIFSHDPDINGIAIPQ
jgi:hypothetical protein